MSTQPGDAYLCHRCQASIRQVSKQWIYLSQCKQHRMGTWSGRSRRGEGGEWRRRRRGRVAGGREYVMHSALPASGTLMTIMSCHTSCRTSQQILPLSLPFSNQCYWSVPGVKGQERINRGRVADAAGGEGLTPDRSMTPPVCHWCVMIIHLPLTQPH